jgi:hypothetical protein
MDECLGWVERALAALDMAPGSDQRRRMQLYAALGWLQMYATARLERSTAAWRTALRLAEELGDTDYQLRVLWALWADRTNHAEFREALALASQFRSLSARAGNVADQLVGDRMTGRRCISWETKPARVSALSACSAAIRRLSTGRTLFASSSINA